MECSNSCLAAVSAMEREVITMVHAERGTNPACGTFSSFCRNIVRNREEAEAIDV